MNQHNLVSQMKKMYVSLNVTYKQSLLRTVTPLANNFLLDSKDDFLHVVKMSVTSNSSVQLGSCIIPIQSVTPISGGILGRSAPQLKRTSQCSKFKFFRSHLLVTSISINWLALQKLILVCKTKMYLNYTLT